MGLRCCCDERSVAPHQGCEWLPCSTRCHLFEWSPCLRGLQYRNSSSRGTRASNLRLRVTCTRPCHHCCGRCRSGNPVNWMLRCATADARATSAQTGVAFTLAPDESVGRLQGRRPHRRCGCRNRRPPACPQVCTAVHRASREPSAGGKSNTVPKSAARTSRDAASPPSR